MKLLKDYNIKTKSAIAATVRPTLSSVTAKHRVKDDVTLDVVAFDTIEIMKTKIQDKKEVPPDQQRLVFEKALLENDRTLEDYNIQERATLQFLRTWAIAAETKLLQRLRRLGQG